MSKLNLNSFEWVYNLLLLLRPLMHGWEQMQLAFWLMHFLFKILRAAKRKLMLCFRSRLMPSMWVLSRLFAWSYQITSCWEFCHHVWHSSWFELKIVYIYISKAYCRYSEGILANCWINIMLSGGLTQLVKSKGRFCKENLLSVLFEIQRKKCTYKWQ